MPETIFIPLADMANRDKILAGKKKLHVDIVPGIGNTYTVEPAMSRGRAGGSGLVPRGRQGRTGRLNVKQIVKPAKRTSSKPKRK